MIRLADPERIETIESEHMDLLTGARVEYLESGPFAILDAESEWYAFPGRSVRKKGNPDGRLISRDISRLRKDGKLMIYSGVGIAQIVPVQPNSRIWIECVGRFDGAEEFSATVVQLPVHPKQP